MPIADLIKFLSTKGTTIHAAFLDPLGFRLARIDEVAFLEQLRTCASRTMFMFVRIVNQNEVFVFPLKVD